MGLIDTYTTFNYIFQILHFFLSSPIFNGIFSIVSMYYALFSHTLPYSCVSAWFTIKCIKSSPSSHLSRFPIYVLAIWAHSIEDSSWMTHRCNSLCVLVQLKLFFYLLNTLKTTLINIKTVVNFTFIEYFENAAPLLFCVICCSWESDAPLIFFPL